MTNWNAGLIPSSFFRGTNGETTTIPKAYINYIFLHEQFKYAGGNFSRVGSSGVVKDHWSADAQLQDITVPKNGYIFVYVSNEGNLDVRYVAYTMIVNIYDNTAMKIKSAENEIEINILQRSNPDTDDYWDANWLESVVKLYSVAEDFTTSSGHVFLIDNPGGGFDINSIYGIEVPYYYEHEIAFKDMIHSEHIIGAYNIQNPGVFIPNPNYNGTLDAYFKAFIK